MCESLKVSKFEGVAVHNVLTNNQKHKQNFQSISLLTLNLNMIDSLASDFKWKDCVVHCLISNHPKLQISKQSVKLVHELWYNVSGF